MPPLLLWHVWPGQGWPASSAQELALVEDLRAAAGVRHPRPTRPNITCLLNALRGGVALTTLLNLLPGVDPADLLAGYELLENRRSQSEHAWQSIVTNADADNLASQTKAARKLMPVPVARIATGAATMPSLAALERVVQEAADRVTRVQERAAAFEEVLSRLTPGDPRGVYLGTRLHNPLEPALWADPYFLPERVGQLSATRVADLLGERRTGIRVTAVLGVGL